MLPALQEFRHRVIFVAAGFTQQRAKDSDSVHILCRHILVQFSGWYDLLPGVIFRMHPDRRQPFEVIKCLLDVYDLINETVNQFPLVLVNIFH